jgi:hypothetical protein
MDAGKNRGRVGFKSISGKLEFKSKSMIEAKRTQTTTTLTFLAAS